MGPTCKILHEFGFYTEIKFAMRIHTHTIRRLEVLYVQSIENRGFGLKGIGGDFVHIIKGGIWLAAGLIACLVVLTLHTNSIVSNSHK